MQNILDSHLLTSCWFGASELQCNIIDAAAAVAPVISPVSPSTCMAVGSMGRSGLGRNYFVCRDYLRTMFREARTLVAPEC